MSEAAPPLDAPASIRLWRGALAQPPAAADVEALSTAERLRAGRFVFERDRRRYLAAHCFLRSVLSAHLGLPAQRIDYREGAFGKPELAPGLGGCAFNMSHSDDVVVVAVAPQGEIGVDVELLRPVSDAQELAASNFTRAEQRELALTPPPLRDLAFLRGWTRKEACLKAVGCGLAIAPESFDAGLAPGERLVQLQARSGSAQVRVWSLHLDDTTVCAVAHVVDSTIALRAERD